MTVIEKTSKLKRLANKNVAIFCESMSEDKEVYEMASKHFGNNIDEVDFKDDSAYIVTDIDNEVRDYYDELNVYVRYVIKKTEKEN